MLRLYTQPIVSKRYLKPALFKGVRYSSSTSNNDNAPNEHLHKISALPFKLPEEKVHQIVNIASYVNQHAFFGIFKIIKSVKIIN